MPGKVVLNLEMRYTGAARLLWNKLTPTRGAEKLIPHLERSASDRSLSLSTRIDTLIMDGKRLPDSRYFAQSLANAGITAVEIPQQMPAAKIEKFLNTLTDKGLRKMSKSLSEMEITLEIEGSKNRLPFVWKDLYFDMLSSEFSYYKQSVLVSSTSSVLFKILGVIGGLFGGGIGALECEELSGIPRENQGVLMIFGLAAGGISGYYLGKLATYLFYGMVYTPALLINVIRYSARISHDHSIGTSPEKVRESIFGKPAREKATPTKPKESEPLKDPNGEDEIDPEDFKGTGGTPPDKSGPFDPR